MHGNCTPRPPCTASRHFDLLESPLLCEVEVVSVVLLVDSWHERKRFQHFVLTVPLIMHLSYKPFDFLCWGSSFWSLTCWELPCLCQKLLHLSRWQSGFVFHSVHEAHLVILHTLRCSAIYLRCLNNSWWLTLLIFFSILKLCPLPIIEGLFSWLANSSTQELSLWSLLLRTTLNTNCSSYFLEVRPKKAIQVVCLTFLREKDWERQDRSYIRKYIR